MRYSEQQAEIFIVLKNTSIYKSPDTVRCLFNNCNKSNNNGENEWAFTYT